MISHQAILSLLHINTAARCTELRALSLEVVRRDLGICKSVRGSLFSFNRVCDFSNIFHHVAEIARQAAQIKMMRKLEKQAMAQAAKEARKQRGKQLLFSNTLLMMLCCVQA